MWRMIKVVAAKIGLPSEFATSMKKHLAAFLKLLIRMRKKKNDGETNPWKTRYFRKFLIGRIFKLKQRLVESNRSRGNFSATAVS